MQKTIEIYKNDELILKINKEQLENKTFTELIMIALLVNLIEKLGGKKDEK